MNEKRVGKRTIALSHPPSVISYANIGGRQESQGPLSSYFDELSDDSFFGEKTWEKGESAMQKKVVRRAMEQAPYSPKKGTPNSRREKAEPMHWFSRSPAST